MLAILRFWKVWLPICTSVLLLRIIDDLRTEIRLQYSTIITERRVLEELCMHCLCVQFLCPRTQNSSIIYSGFIIFLSLFRNPGSSFMWPPLEFFLKNGSLRFRVATVASIIVVMMNRALELMRKLALLWVCTKTLKWRKFQHWVKMSKCGPRPCPHLWTCDSAATAFTDRFTAFFYALNGLFIGTCL